MSRYNSDECLSHHSWLSSKCEIISFVDETTAREDTEIFITVNNDDVNIQSDVNLQISLHQVTEIKELSKAFIT